MLSPSGRRVTLAENARRACGAAGNRPARPAEKRKTRTKPRRGAPASRAALPRDLCGPEAPIAAARDTPRVLTGTIHAAKGREADVVCVLLDLAPAQRRRWESRDRNDLLRLFYVVERS